MLVGSYKILSFYPWLKSIVYQGFNTFAFYILYRSLCVVASKANNGKTKIDFQSVPFVSVHYAYSECAIAAANQQLSMTGRGESEAPQAARILVRLGSLMYLPLSIEID